MNNTRLGSGSLLVCLVLISIVILAAGKTYIDDLAEQEQDRLKTTHQIEETGFYFAESPSSRFEQTSSTLNYVKNGETVWSSDVMPKITIDTIQEANCQYKDGKLFRELLITGEPCAEVSGHIEHPAMGFVFQNFTVLTDLGSSTESIRAAATEAGYERLRYAVEDTLETAKTKARIDELNSLLKGK